MLIPTDELIHPRVEPEIVFVLVERLEGPAFTSASAMAAVRSVYAGVEVIDSRYIDFKFTLPTSSRIMRPRPGSSSAASSGTPATGAAVQGHPAEALALAANALAERGLAREAGWIVLTGGMTDAVFVEPGQQIVAEFTNLGSVTVAGS